ncbi:MAG TPA: RCC1 domain-containing protein, partial [Anaeromyxobacter sp.]
ADPGAPVPALGATSVFAVGGDHGCVVAPAGTVTCWGKNTDGQLGDGTTTTPPNPGTQVPVSGR